MKIAYVLILMLLGCLALSPWTFPRQAAREKNSKPFLEITLTIPNATTVDKFCEHWKYTGDDKPRFMQQAIIDFVEQSVAAVDSRSNSK